MTHDCSGTPSWTTTALYTRVAVDTIRVVTSPLDKLGLTARAERTPPATPDGRLCAPRWRSPTSFAPMARRFAPPMPATSALTS